MNRVEAIATLIEFFISAYQHDENEVKAWFNGTDEGKDLYLFLLKQAAQKLEEPCRIPSASETPTVV